MLDCYDCGRSALDVAGKSIHEENIIHPAVLTEVHVDGVSWPDVEHRGLADFYSFLGM